MRVWGVGPVAADVEVAKAGCEVCPVLDGCVERFAAVPGRVDAQMLAGMVVGGLHGRELLAAVNRARRVAA